MLPLLWKGRLVVKSLLSNFRLMIAVFLFLVVIYLVPNTKEGEDFLLKIGSVTK